MFTHNERRLMLEDLMDYMINRDGALGYPVDKTEVKESCAEIINRLDTINNGYAILEGMLSAPIDGSLITLVCTHRQDLQGITIVDAYYDNGHWRSQRTNLKITDTPVAWRKAL